jgi:hypothetical protein
MISISNFGLYFKIKATFVPARRFEVVRGSRRIAPLILNLGVRMKASGKLQDPGRFNPRREPRCLLNRVPEPGWTFLRKVSCHSRNLNNRASGP